VAIYHDADSPNRAFITANAFNCTSFNFVEQPPQAKTMSQNANTNKERPLRDVLESLKSVVQSIDQLIPGILVGLTVFSVISVYIISLNTTIGYLIVLLLIIFTAILIYFRTRNYGESALGLAAGLLTFFTVEFNTQRSTLFFVAWTTFSAFALVISSVNLASRSQQIIRDAVVAIDPKKQKDLESSMKKFSNEFSQSPLGPIQRAEVMREFAFRRLPFSNFRDGLSGVVVLYEISRVDHLELARFFADIYRIFPSQKNQYAGLVDFIYVSMRQSSVSPKEYIDAFNNSRRYILSQKLSAREILKTIQVNLEHGVTPTDMHYLEK